MARLTVGVCAETTPGECRVALVPEVVGRLAALGARVAVQEGAGAAAGFGNGAYTRAGAAVLSREDVLDRADVIVGVQRPGSGARDRLRPGQALAGLLRPLHDPLTVRYWADHGITAISLDLLTESDTAGCRPAFATRPVDAAAEQARITGHEAVLTGVLHSGHALPYSVTGTAEQAARVLVVGTGPAGRQAVRTARSLGAVTATCSIDGSRPMNAVRSSLDHRIPAFDIVVVTAQELSPRAPDVMVGAATVNAMAPGSVIVDTTVEPDGGSVAAAVPDAVVTVPPGVTVVGAGHLPSYVAHAASVGYAERVTALLDRFTVDGHLAIDLADPLHAALVVTHRGNILCEEIRRHLFRLTEVAGLP